VERALAESRTRAGALILAGRVSVAGHERVKPGTPVAEDAEIAVGEPEHPWVSRGGVKLDFGLTHFAIEPKGRICLDLGASTGGFTDVLLARGASRVYALDVGYGQLHGRLRSDARVVLREKVNARFLTRSDVPEAPSLLVADLSFISLTLVLPAAVPLLAEEADVLVLVKPQFEAARGEVGRGGIVRDEGVRTRALARVTAAAERLSLASRGAIPSPITGAEGNVELLAAFRRNPATLPG
jgi:23S rRNA (cytidine1920-2'-O)/16S rRNA (cytidine1409-2'-O)-methyltransferase